MKKMIMLSLSVIVSMLLAACKSELFYVVDIREIVSIEIIDVQQHTTEVVYTTLFHIDEDKIDDFIKDLSLIPFVRMYSDPRGFSGECILIRYSNDDYEIIGSRYISRYTKFGEVIKWHNYYANKMRFEELISSYRQ